MSHISYHHEEVALHALEQLESEAEDRVEEVQMLNALLSVTKKRIKELHEAAKDEEEIETPDEDGLYESDGEAELD